MIVTACTILLAKQLTNAPQIRTGNTPTQMPGTSGWLPSGKGQQLPTAKLVDGKPVGMWWSIPFESNPARQTITTVFLPDGTLLQTPQISGGKLIEATKRTAKANWTLANGMMKVNTANGGEMYGALKPGKDSVGDYFDYLDTRYRPCLEVTPEKLVGTWEISGVIDLTFSPNGQVKHVLPPGDGTGTSKWILDGYLLALDRGKDDYLVNSIYMMNLNTIMIGKNQYTKIE